MQLIDLIQSIEWLNVQIALWSEYPAAEDDIEAYEKVFSQLQAMPAKPSGVTIKLSLETDDFDQGSYVDVVGYYTDPAERTDPFSNSLALEFVPWNEWLGMHLDKETLSNFTELEIIAHCLYEMTFAGFEEEEIQDQLDHVKDIKEEYEGLSTEEKTNQTTAAEEHKAKTGQDDRNEDSNETKTPMILETVNRDVLIVFYKQPFIDWVNFVYDDDKVECPELLEHDQGNIYLIPEFNSYNEAKEYVRENFVDIFENELFEWCEDDESWPQDLTWEFFERCFHYSWQSVVVDMTEGEIQKEIF